MRTVTMSTTSTTSIAARPPAASQQPWSFSWSAWLPTPAGWLRRSPRTAAP